MSCLIRHLIVIPVVLLAAVPAQTETQNDPDEIDRSSLTDLIVELKDDDGKPVAGAAVMVYTARREEKHALLEDSFITF